MTEQDGPEIVRRERQWILQYTEILFDTDEDRSEDINSFQCTSEQDARERYDRLIVDANRYGDTLKDVTITETAITSRVIKVIKLEGTSVEEKESTQAGDSKGNNEANKETNETNMVNSQQNNESNDEESPDRS